ncbi:MFS transporter [Plantactinospora veratri]
MVGATARSAAHSVRRTRIGGFWSLWTATVVSRLGDALRTPALALLAASVSRDPRIVAAVVVAGQLPPLLFGLLGGVYADRWDRRRMMATVDGLRAVLVAGFALLVVTGEVGIAALVGCAFLLGTLGVLFDAAAFAVLPGIVSADRLAVANGRLQAGTAVAGGFVGAPLAGVLFAVAAALPFAVDAVTFAVAALLALTLRPTPVPTRAPTRAPNPTPTPPLGSAPRPVGPRATWRAAGDGLRWIWRDATLRRITGLTMVTNLATSGLIAIIVLYALEVLAVPAAGYGLFMAAAILGALAGDSAPAGSPTGSAPCPGCAGCWSPRRSRSPRWPSPGTRCRVPSHSPSSPPAPRPGTRSGRRTVSATSPPNCSAGSAAPSVRSHCSPPRSARSWPERSVPPPAYPRCCTPPPPSSPWPPPPRG